MTVEEQRTPERRFNPNDLFAARKLGLAIRVKAITHSQLESPDRFALDLAVQLAGHLKRLGVTLIPASAPDHFMRADCHPGSAMLHKATPVAKLKAARAA